MVGWVSASARAAPDRLPSRTTAKNERYSSQPGCSARFGDREAFCFIQMCIANKRLSPICLYQDGADIQLMTKTALIVGATGGVGSEIARVLAKRGYLVRGLHRNPAQARARMASLSAIDWVEGDA